jgi:hypothetical protein
MADCRRTGAPRSSADCDSAISLAVEDVLDLVILRLAPENGRAFLRRRLREQLGEIEPLGLPVLDQLAAIEHLHLPDHLIEAAESELCHQLADFLGDEEEVVDDVFRAGP